MATDRSSRPGRLIGKRPAKGIRRRPEDLFDSDALRINLEETAVEQVAVDPKYNVLQETVAGYRGILKTLEALLFELNHPFKNWEIILPELRAFALKHFSSYARHPQGPQAIAVIIDVFLDAAAEFQPGGLCRPGHRLSPGLPGKNRQ